MMLPRETLAEEWDEAEMPAYPPTRYGSVHAGGIEPARAQAIAEMLMTAENPVAFTAYLGRKPQAVAVLDRPRHDHLRYHRGCDDRCRGRRSGRGRRCSGSRSRSRRGRRRSRFLDEHRARRLRMLQAHRP